MGKSGHIWEIPKKKNLQDLLMSCSLSQKEGQRIIKDVSLVSRLQEPKGNQKMPSKREAESFIAKMASAIVTSAEEPLYFHWMGGVGPVVNRAESVLTEEVIYSFKYLGRWVKEMKTQ